MTKIVYTGPPHQTCAALAEQTDYPALLEPGAVYSVPDELAASILESSAHFAPAEADTGPSLAELKARAAELGVSVDGRPTKQKLADAIAAHEAAAADAADNADEDAATEDSAGEPGEADPPSEED